MKKTIKNIALGLLLAITALPFISCGHDPVFYGIIHDVVPEAALVNGNITSIVRCTINSDEYLFLSNGGALQYKSLDSAKHGEWESDGVKLPFKTHHYNYYETSSEGIGHQGELVHRVLADDSNIYIFTASFEQDDRYGVVMPKAFHLWTKPLDSLFNNSKDDWYDIVDTREDYFKFSLNVKETEVELDFSFFYTNTPKQAHREAYLAVKDSNNFKYFKLNGAADPVECTSSIEANKVQVYDKSTKINSAFYIGNELKFSDSLVVITNETKDDDATFACLAGMKSNYYTTSDLYIFTAGALKEEKISASSPIASLAVTADSLIIGKGSYGETYTSTGGLERVLITNNLPETEIKSFTNNAQYQITTSYIVLTLLCADPTKNEEEATLYASVSYRGTTTSSSASYNNIGLWSYYPSRGNWNRE